MRDIKFRAREVVSGSWVFGSPIFIPYGRCRMFYDDGYGFISDVKVNAKTVGQYTGLKDKNGVEIYEGDIVRVYFVTETADGDRVTDYSGVVQFGVFKIDYYGEEASTVSGWYFNSKDGQSKFWDENSLAECNESCVIIGNIHEHPNLLK